MDAAVLRRPRGLTRESCESGAMEPRNLPRVGRGAFSEVFAIDEARILKAFRDVAVTGAPSSDPRFVPTIAFAAELAAYERLQSHSDLEPYFPQFFGAADPNDFLLDSGEAFSSGCGLVLELIPGEPRKLSELPKPVLSEAEKVLDEVKERIGVDDPWDGSGFVPGTRRAVTLIDFATPTAHLVALDDLISQHGSLPGRFERALGIFEAKKRWVGHRG